jgi:hypothetical protein
MFNHKESKYNDKMEMGKFLVHNLIPVSIFKHILIEQGRKMITLWQIVAY